MGHELQVARVYPPHEFTWTGVSGYDANEAFFNLLHIYKVANNAEDEYQEYFEVQREDLGRALKDLETHGPIYQANEEEIQEIATLIGDGDEDNLEENEECLVNSLQRIIEQSDQCNEWMLLTWF